MYPIHAFGIGGAAGPKYLPRLRTGEWVGCFGLTEPDGGSDPGGMRTRRTQVDGGFLLNGSKTWITNSPIADVLVVWAKDDDGDIRGFILERGMAGLDARQKSRANSRLRASVTGEIMMEDVFVPDENLLPGRQGLRGPFSCLNNARYGIAWGALGAAEFCWHAARDYTLAAQDVRPPAGRQPSSSRRSSPTCRPRSRSGCTACCALGRLMDEGRAGAGDDRLMQAQLLRQGAGHRPRRPRHAWRQRHRRRVSRDPPRDQSRNGEHL